MENFGGFLSFGDFPDMLVLRLGAGLALLTATKPPGQGPGRSALELGIGNFLVGSGHQLNQLQQPKGQKNTDELSERY